MAIDPQGSRLLEALVKGVGTASKKSEIPPRGEKGRKEEAQDADSVSEQGLLPHASIQQLIRSFQGHYAKAALHPRGGFVVTAFYNTAEVCFSSRKERKRKTRNRKRGRIGDTVQLSEKNDADDDRISFLGRDFSLVFSVCLPIDSADVLSHEFSVYEDRQAL